MPRGQVLSIPDKTSTLVTTLSREQKASIALLNPNDGILYVHLNGPASNTPTMWDWKVPSQSYCQLPGPWESVGVYYSDQSGSGRAGEVNLYESDSQIAIPSFVAIGRAVQQAGSTMDISQGQQPSNPPAGSVRLWIDGSGQLHVLDSNGKDEVYVDTTSPLNGEVQGVISNTRVVTLGQQVNFTGRLTGPNGGYIQDYGSNPAGYIVISQLTVTPGSFSSGPFSLNGAGVIGGALSCLSSVSVASGIYANGNIIYWNQGGGAYYIQLNGNYCQFVSQNVLSWGWLGLAGNPGINIGWSGSYITTTHPIAIQGASNSPAAMLATPQRIGTQICLYDAGGSNCFGLGINSGELTLISSGQWGFRANNNAGTLVATIGASGDVSGRTFTAISNSYYFTNTSVAITWNGTYLNHSHSIQYNTTGNQILWPNGSYISGNAGYVQGSQEALKENVETLIDSDCLVQVLDPRMVVHSYTWPEDSRRSMGFMAEEVAEVLPAYVIRDDKGDPSGYVPQELVALLWGAVRELDRRMNAATNPA